MVLTKPRHLLVALGTFAVLSIMAVFAMDSLREYDRELAALEAQLRAETRLLAEHTSLSVAAADVVLMEMEATIRRLGLDVFSQDRVYWDSFRGMLDRSPQLEALVIVDADGKLVFSTAVFPLLQVVDVSDREYFTAHLQGEKHFVGRPIIGRSTGQPIIPVSIRLEDANGQFDGVMISALDMTYFQRPFTGAPDKVDLHIGIYRDDGVVLSAMPGLNGHTFGDASPATGDKEDIISSLESSPGGKRFVVRRHVEDYPIVVSASYDYDAFLRGLYPVWTINGLVSLVFAIGITLSIFFISRSMRLVDSERENQLALARQQRETEQLSRAIIGHLPNGGVSVFNHDLRYVFAGGQAFSGDAEFARAMAPGRLIDESHASRKVRQKLGGLARNALKGIESEAEIAGHGRIYKVIAAPLVDDEGSIRRGLMLTQDITALKTAHRELEERNRELQELSLTDSLLGIANRRAFDQEIKREWRRAERKHRSLSLLMVDVDCFKPYNDAYGHMQGDLCLQQVAGVLETAVTRPADMVARYGGEEIAVLLPECDVEGALRVAERIHSLLADAALPFPESPIADAVTVSIGIAVAEPRQDLSPAALIEAADEALYKAKESGRNRTVTANPCPATLPE